MLGMFYIKNTLISVMVISTSGCSAVHHRKDKMLSKNHLRETALFEESKMTVTVMSENHPDAGLVSEADVG